MAGTTAGGALFTALLWLAGKRMNPADPADLLTTIAAEDTFDAAPDLPRITARTLIIGGARDRFYGTRLFVETANRIPAARLCLYRHQGHAGTITSRHTVAEIDHFLTTSGR
jgi:homoserine acetyltransferase